MRGRTLDDAFIILDDTQNTTPPQMKMLTRIGFGSGCDYRRRYSGGFGCRGVFRFDSCSKSIEKVEGIEFSYLSQLDVVRHPLVQKIINAYEREEHHGKES